MAGRTVMTGFEISNDEYPITSRTGTITIDSGITAHGGTKVLKCDSTASNLTAVAVMTLPALTASATYWLRAYFCFSALPTTSQQIMSLLGTFGQAQGIAATITSTGKMRLVQRIDSVQLGSDSAATVTANSSTWYRVELKAVLNASSQITDCELQLDGVSVATATGLTLTSSTGSFVGWSGAPGASKSVYVDDYAMNRTLSGTAWPGDGKIVLLKPTSDGQAGSWTGGVGGVTNLFNAVDNTPPVGTATETDTSQIESIDASGDNATDEYRANVGTPISAGIGSGDTFTAALPVLNHGEDIATGTKTGTFGIQTPTGLSQQTFTFGNDVAALGTYPTGWIWSPGVVLEAAVITPSTSIVLGVRKTDTGTRVASVDFLGAYLEFAPGVAAAKSIVAPMRASRNTLLRR